MRNALSFAWSHITIQTKKLGILQAFLYHDEVVMFSSYKGSLGPLQSGHLITSRLISNYSRKSGGEIDRARDAGAGERGWGVIS